MGVRNNYLFYDGDGKSFSITRSDNELQFSNNGPSCLWNETELHSKFNYLRGPKIKLVEK